MGRDAARSENRWPDYRVRIMRCTHKPSSLPGMGGPRTASPPSIPSASEPATHREPSSGARCGMQRFGIRGDAVCDGSRANDVPISDVPVRTRTTCLRVASAVSSACGSAGSATRTGAIRYAMTIEVPATSGGAWLDDQWRQSTLRSRTVPIRCSPWRCRNGVALDECAGDGVLYGRFRAIGPQYVLYRPVTHLVVRERHRRQAGRELSSDQILVVDASRTRLTGQHTVAAARAGPTSSARRSSTGPGAGRSTGGSSCLCRNQCSPPSRCCTVWRCGARSCGLSW